MAPADDKRAVVLFSGGLDSTTVLAIALDSGYSVYALSVDYGQRNVGELRAATAIGSRAGLKEHLRVDLNSRLFARSSLVDAKSVVPHRDVEPAVWEGLPSTYVPARNTVLLSLALAWSDNLGGADIFIGISGGDRERSPDCTPVFLDAFRGVAALGTRFGAPEYRRISICAPLIDLSKSEVVALGLGLGVDYALTRSCYELRDDQACGTCDACLVRRLAFASHGLVDPATERAVGVHD